MGSVLKKVWGEMQPEPQEEVTEKTQKALRSGV